jgi:LacI family transcriptional regulator
LTDTDGTATTPAKRWTMLDVAQKAGVSRTAVSLILNNRESRIAPETQQRVRDIAESLGFRPSRVALQLRTQRSQLIGLISDEIASGPFAGGLIAGAQAAAGARDHALMLMNTGVAGDISTIDRDLLEDRQTDGLVFATVMTRKVDLGPLGPRTATVLLNCYSDDASLCQVLPDDRAGGMAAAGLVIGMGHERIAFVSGEEGTFPAVERLAGHRAALEAAGIPFSPELVRYGDWTAETGYRMSTELLTGSAPPTAIVCGNDRIALGAYDAIRDLGMTVAKDVSVVGYDDQREIAPYMHPPLTTIRLPYEAMGRLAVEALLDGYPGGTQLVPCEPIVRGSVAARVR